MANDTQSKNQIKINMKKLESIAFKAYDDVATSMPYEYHREKAMHAARMTMIEYIKSYNDFPRLIEVVENAEDYPGLRGQIGLLVIDIAYYYYRYYTNVTFL